jgi:outer membrane protein OmpA-like peptidoglycan-associated protein
MLDTLELPQVQSIVGTETEALEQHSVPGLEGDFLQELGRRAVRIELTGVLAGDEAAGALKGLREKHRAAAPVSFVADIATATHVDKVLIEALQVREIAGRPQRFEYEIALVEYTPPPPPQHEDPIPPPPPPDTKTGKLIVKVFVDGQPDFDFSTTTVQLQDKQDDGTTSRTELKNRNGNVWTNDPTAPGDCTAVATVTDPPLSGSATGKVSAGQTTTVEIHLKVGPPIAHAFIVHYWFDRAFIEPCLRSVLRDVADYALAHPQEKILIVGHTDLTGGDQYNQALSERRARGVFAYLTAGREGATSLAEWNALRHSGAAEVRLEDNWSVREYQHLLSGLNFYSGQIDEQHGPLTDAAVRNFQSDHNITVDGVVGDATWTAMIKDYLSADALRVPKSQFLPNCAGDFVKWLGSGEKDPVRNTEDAWRPNRRTEILFVRATALPGKVARPLTFNKPAPGAVNAKWCAGGDGDPVVILSRPDQKPNTFLVQPIDPAAFTLKGSMTFEDGTPATGIRYVLTAPDGEYLDGEVPAGTNRGRPIAGTTDTSGKFTVKKPTGVGLYILVINGDFNVRLKSSAANSGTKPTLCARLDGSQNLDVVLSKADGVDPRRKLSATIHNRNFTPRPATAVAIDFPDGSNTTATTDANGQFSVAMNDAFPTAKFRYQASDDPNDFESLDYFIDVGDISTDEGVSRRLHNIGFEPESSLPKAIAQFQGTQGLNPTGTLDDATRAQLNRVYSGDVPLIPVFDDTPSGDSPDAPTDP